mmetsp:Transcript_16570/g.36802  ORF Transcript_16570/g.36802 Transcript_16570/m.36802 type:complete len:112 (+) Transcript_16570:156-491(+)
MQTRRLLLVPVPLRREIPTRCITLAQHRAVISVLFTSERPGGDPPSEDAIIPAATVVEWVDFMKARGITDVLVLLDDNELDIYEPPGLLRMYEQEGLAIHRAPMGEAGAPE